MKTEIDWNIFCECVNCMSIHPKGYNETKGIELPVSGEHIPTYAGLLAQLEAVKAQLAAAHGLKQLDLEPEFRQWTKVRRRPARRYLKK